MRTRTLVAAYGLSLAALLTAPSAAVGAPIPLPPCHTEDSANCVWDAPHMGNHTGRSFVNVGGHIVYLDGKPAPYGNR
jgi:hypothetical protein